MVEQVMCIYLKIPETGRKKQVKPNEGNVEM